MFAFVSLLTWFIIILCFILFFPLQLALFLITLPFDRSRSLLHYHSSLWCWLALTLAPLWRTRIEGMEKLDRKRACIIVMNHQSLIDVLIAFRLFFPAKMIGKKALAYVPIVGWNLMMSGHILVDRKSRQSQFDAIRRMETMLNRGESLLVFPEGTRTRDGRIAPFKKGAFRTAAGTGTPVQPIVIDGPFQLLPRKGIVADHFGRFTVRIMDPMEAKAEERPVETAERVRAAMNRELEVMRAGKGG